MGYFYSAFFASFPVAFFAAYFLLAAFLTVFLVSDDAESPGFALAAFFTRLLGC